MAEVAKPVVVITSWEGMMPNVDPKDLPPGAAEVQVNATSVAYGEMVVRHGVRQVSFEA
jgi:hypothetical protein